MLLCVYADWLDRTAGKEVMWAERDPARTASDKLIKFSGIPFMLLGSRILECCCGMLRAPKKKVGEGYSVSVSNAMLSPLFGKTCATTQKNVKSHVLLDFEKNVKKTYI